MPRDYTPTTPQDKLDSMKKSRFLRCLAENGGFIEQAIKEAKTSRRFINGERELDADFDGAIRAIIEMTNEQLLVEARRRAMGYESPIIYQGKITGTKIEVSDTLLMFYIKGRMPEFRDGPGARKGDVPLTDDQLNGELRDWLREKMKAEKTTGRVDVESGSVS